MMVVEDISAVRGTRRVLDRVSLVVDTGEVIAIVGPNGAGKSSLLSVIAGDLSVERGTVRIADVDLSTLTVAERARVRAVLPQDHAIAFPFRCEDVVLLGRVGSHRGRPGKRDREIAEEALALVDGLPLIGRPFPELSGGERQRIQLARALAQLWDGDTPRMLLLDEPTSALDPRRQHEAWARVRSFLKERLVGVIGVVHDLNLAASYADRVVILSQGRITADDVPDRALSAANIESVFGLPVVILPHPSDPSRPLVVPIPVTNPHDGGMVGLGLRAGDLSHG